jgi:hypothetical protein
LQFCRELLSARVDIKNFAQKPVQRDVVFRRIRMCDDDVRREFLNLVKGGKFVFIDVDDHVRRIQCAQSIELDVLGAADLRHVAHRVARMNAEPGAADDLRAEAKAEQKFGDRWHQRNDARVRAGAWMRVPGGIDATRR